MQSPFFMPKGVPSFTPMAIRSFQGQASTTAQDISTANNTFANLGGGQSAESPFSLFQSIFQLFQTMFSSYFNPTKPKDGYNQVQPDKPISSNPNYDGYDSYNYPPATPSPTPSYPPTTPSPNPTPTYPPTAPAPTPSYPPTTPAPTPTPVHNTIYAYTGTDGSLKTLFLNVPPGTANLTKYVTQQVPRADALAILEQATKEANTPGAARENLLKEIEEARAALG